MAKAGIMDRTNNISYTLLGMTMGATGSLMAKLLIVIEARALITKGAGCAGCPPVSELNQRSDIAGATPTMAGT